MTIETIKAGQWVITEGGVPEYFIYKLLKGSVSIYKSARKIRQIEIKENDTPITLGITALFRDDRLHMASVKAESDIEVDRMYIEQIRGVLANEVPIEIRNEIDVMVRTITTGNEIVSLLNRFCNMPKINMTIPEGIDSQAREVLAEIDRLYKLITADVDPLCNH